MSAKQHRRSRRYFNRKYIAGYYNVKNWMFEDIEVSRVKSWMLKDIPGNRVTIIKESKIDLPEPNTMFDDGIPRYVK